LHPSISSTTYSRRNTSFLSDSRWVIVPGTLQRQYGPKLLSPVQEDDAQACKDHGIRTDLCDQIELPKVHRWSEEDDNCLTPGELAKLIRAWKTVAPKWYPLAAAHIWTGEVTALEWQDIDEEAGLLWVKRSQWAGRVGAPKGNRRRSIGLAPELAEVLREHRRHLIAEQHPGLGSGLAFPSAAGKHLQPSALRKPLQKALEAAGVKQITPHGLRRTFNNIVRQRSTGIVVRSMLGHVSEQMTE
jgi:integrase